MQNGWLWLLMEDHIFYSMKIWQVTLTLIFLQKNSSILIKWAIWVQKSTSNYNQYSDFEKVISQYFLKHLKLDKWTEKNLDFK